MEKLALSKNSGGYAFLLMLWVVLASDSTLQGSQTGLQDLESELRIHYPARQTDATTSNQLFIVKKSGIIANTIAGEMYWDNDYKRDGRITQPRIEANKSRVPNGVQFGVGVRVPASKSTIPTRQIALGEHVYVAGVQVGHGEVIFDLETAQVASGDRSDGPFRARIHFKCSKRTLTLEDLTDIDATVNQVLSRPTETRVSEEGARERADGDIEPLGRRGAPELIHPGLTIKEVESLLGQPTKIERLNGTVTYLFTGFKVIFVEGKVKSVQ